MACSVDARLNKKIYKNNLKKPPSSKARKYQDDIYILSYFVFPQTQLFTQDFLSSLSYWWQLMNYFNFSLSIIGTNSKWDF